MNQKTKYDFLIIGAGIAGLCLAQQLEKLGKSFLIIDQETEHKSSKVAAGMFNPISGKRMTVNWRVQELLESLHESFNEFETLLGKNYLVSANIIQSFGNIKESNDFTLQLEKSNFSRFIGSNQIEIQGLNQEFGSFEVLGSGWVKTKEWIEDYQHYLSEKGVLIRRKADWQEIKPQGIEWRWRDHDFEKVVSCEGYQYQENPHFHWLPFKLCKGEVLQIKCVGLNQQYILKKGVYLVHQYDDVYKVGATYEWDFENEKPTQAGKENLIDKLEKLLTLPYEIIKQESGIRPTTRDRAAILGEHPLLKNLYCFNGLGTKGMLQAPFLAKHFFEAVYTNTGLDPKVSIERFYSFYSTSQI
ncbi:MAG: FAD-binding oxidoreductase [Bacteroidia bacterium]|nr:FAD-binding oxidoreductase [Bacteroidia bacterium]